MARGRVHVEREIAAPPGTVWRILRDFAGAWHPAIAEIRLQRDDAGAEIRAFRAKGEDKLYRERLTWFSDSDQSLDYTHVEGIAGARAYDAAVAVRPSAEGRAVVTWTADVEADEPRLSEITAGTAFIFNMGLDALADLAGNDTAGYGGPTEAPALPAPAALETRMLGSSPRLALTVAGAGTGRRLVLFLHGIGGGRRNWDRQVALAGTLMPAAALDLRGYGDSEAGPAQTTIDACCDDILRVMQSLGADRLILDGLSYGSWIATSFAMRHAELLDGLVLSGGCTGMSEAGTEERRRFRESREVPLDAGMTPADFAPQVVDVLAGPDAGADVRQALLQSMAAIPAATYRDALTCFTNPPERFDFSRLAMPVLMMTGEFDHLASPSEIRDVARRIRQASPKPDLRFEVIARAGHVCNLEAPDRYNRILLEFLGRFAR